jgi:hypothetical protein
MAFLQIKAKYLIGSMFGIKVKFLELGFLYLFGYFSGDSSKSISLNKQASALARLGQLRC